MSNNIATRLLTPCIILLLYTMACDSVLVASYDPLGNRTTTKNTRVNVK